MARTSSGSARTYCPTKKQVTWCPSTTCGRRPPQQLATDPTAATAARMCCGGYGHPGHSATQAPVTPWTPPQPQRRTTTLMTQTLRTVRVTTAATVTLPPPVTGITPGRTSSCCVMSAVYTLSAMGTCLSSPTLGSLHLALDVLHPRPRRKTCG